MKILFRARFALAQVLLLACIATTADAAIVFLGDDPNNSQLINSGDTAVFAGLESPGSFGSNYYFSLNTVLSVSSFVSQVAVPPLVSIANLALDLYDATTNTLLTPPSGGSTSFSFSSLMAGDYYVRVLGDATGLLGGVTFGAVQATAPVPLPAAAWLLLSGLGGLAVIARRRNASSAPSVPVAA